MTKGREKKANSYVSIEMHSSKRKQPNWEHKEIITFIRTKLDEHIPTLNKVDPWDRFEIFVTKWKKSLWLSWVLVFSTHEKWPCLQRQRGNQLWIIQENFLSHFKNKAWWKSIGQWTHMTRLHIIWHDFLVIVTTTWFWSSWKKASIQPSTYLWFHARCRHY